MAYLNDNYLKLKAGYLFPEIGRRVREVAAELGYTKLMMWSGTLADSGHISLTREMYFGRRYMRDGSVLLGHANNMNADKLFDRLHAVVVSRGLEMVTLADAMGPTFNPQPTPSETPIIVSPSASPSSPI